MTAGLTVQFQCGCQIIRTSDGEPYLPPYTIMKLRGLSDIRTYHSGHSAWLSETCGTDCGLTTWKSRPASG